MTTRNVFRTITLALPLVLLTAVGILVSIGQRLVRFDEPFAYRSDGLFYGFIIKSVMEQGWYSGYSNRLGAPAGASLLDFPIPELGNILLVRIFTTFSGNWAVVYNSVYLATFFLCALSAYWVLSKFGTRTAWATLGALVFAFLPFHLIRVGHLFLANYSAVPIAVWLCVEAWRRGSRELDANVARSKPNPFTDAACCLVVAVNGIYYAFFACMLLSASAIAAMFSANRIRGAVPAAKFILAISVAVALSLAPNLWFRVVEGPNPASPTRMAADSEIFGLKIAQLFVPKPSHGLEIAREAARGYNTTAPLVNENYSSSLGIVAGVGFLLAMVLVVRQLSARVDVPTLRDHLAYLCLVAVLFGTVGGFGAIFARVVSPQMRALNRISVYIAFISIAILMLSLQRAASVSQWRFTSRRWLGIAALGGIAMVATIDQLMGVTDPVWSAPDVQTSDRQFIRAVEAALPNASLILQLPYHAMPEGGPQEGMGEYEHLLGFLNSSGLRWSFGGMKGRPADEWYRTLDRNPIERQVSIAQRSGFGGIYINRKGYSDRGSTIEKTLHALLGPPLVVSADSNLALYRLQPMGTGLVSLDELHGLDWAQNPPAPVPDSGGPVRSASCAIDNVDGALPKPIQDVGKKRELRLIGWAAAVDRRKSPDRIAIALENTLGEKTYTRASAGLDRADVARQFGVPGLSKSGFDVAATLTPFASGVYRITIALDYGGELLTCDPKVAVTVLP